MADALFELDLTLGAAREILRGEGAFSLGEVLCDAACGACFLADAGRDRLVRFDARDGAVGARADLEIPDGLDLPPRYLGPL